MGAIGWRKRKIAEAYVTDTYNNNFGEMLRDKLRERIEEAERAQEKPLRPTNMTSPELLSLSFTDVYLAIRKGDWTIDDFAIWGTEIERYARRNP